MRFKPCLWAALLGLWVSCVFADTLTGIVIEVSDGDTVKMLDGDQRQQTVRLAGIDAPEKSQDFGLRAKSQLSLLCLHQAVEADVRTMDRYGRTVARVRCNGVDAANKMLQEGLAWHFTRYALTQPRHEAVSDKEAQDLAKKAGLGLWSVSEPISPWDWRVQQRERRAH